jgi:hypothetical protein
VLAAQGALTIDDESEPGAWAEALPYLPSQQLPLAAAPDETAVNIAAGRAAERADVLAALTRRAVNAARVAKHSPSGSDSRQLAEDRRRQLEVVIDELCAGLHEGEALVACDLTAAALAGQETADGE